MLQQGHARLMIAMLAAVAVHALVFFVCSSQPKLKLSAASGVMEVSFVSPTVRHEVQVTSQVVKKSDNKADRPIVKQQTALQTVAVISSAMQSHVQARPSDVGKKATQMGGATVTPVEFGKGSTPPTVALTDLPAEPTHSSEDIASNADMGAVPQGVQQQLLVNLTYPKLARRHGWQGRAEFELRIYKQSVDKLTLLASTGFPVLDHAAERGLAHVRNIPLSNGLYRMPVVFNLR